MHVHDTRPVVVDAAGDGSVRVRMRDQANRNALSVPFVGALREAVQQAVALSPKVLVLCAEGPAFSVGGDLHAFAQQVDAGSYVDHVAAELSRVVLELASADCVVLSAVHAVAAGAGFPLAMAADLVVAAESARFVLAYTAAGLTPDGGATLLSRSVGLHRAMMLALLNPVLTAAEAKDCGLVLDVYPDETFDADLDALVARLLRGSGSAMAVTKRLVRASAADDLAETLWREARAVRSAVEGEDGREGVRAFLDKRDPRFR